MWKKGHDFDHLRTDATPEHGKTKRVAQLRDDAADEEDGDAVGAGLAEDGRTQGKENVAIGKSVEEIEEETQEYGGCELETGQGAG